jgi:hypothetical protein
METWLKIILGIFFGGSLAVAIIWGTLILLGEPKQAEDVRNIPNQVEEAKQNVTNELINSGKDVVTDTGNAIIPAFKEAGESMAQDIKDPVVKSTISGGMTFVGFLLWLVVVIIIVGVILTALGIKVKGINC